MRIEPPIRATRHPALWKYLAETAVLKKRENVPPNLAGEWMRAILAGARYPQTLLSTVLMRLRADKDVNALRVAILKAVLIRNSATGRIRPWPSSPIIPTKAISLAACSPSRNASSRTRWWQGQRHHQGQVLRFGLRSATKGVRAAGKRVGQSSSQDRKAIAGPKGSSSWKRW